MPVLDRRRERPRAGSSSAANERSDRLRRRRRGAALDLDGMPEPNSFTPSQFGVWRGLLRIHSTIFRALDRALLADHGVGIDAYGVLITLVSAGGRRFACRTDARRSRPSASKTSNASASSGRRRCPARCQAPVGRCRERASRVEDLGGAGAGRIPIPRKSGSSPRLDGRSLRRGIAALGAGHPPSLR